MAKIKLLDEGLIDRIAAGEVVERPAAIVKELLDNAKDSGADEVTVELVEGGIERVRVSDNGEGMSEEDARLSIVRHATSKLRAFEDLSSLATLGFRGEALATIASVSKFTLKTRRNDDVAGTQLRVDGGSDPTVSPVACAVGTSVEASELFYNVPARRKFLSAAHTEASHATDKVVDFALANPFVQVTLFSNARRVRSYVTAMSRFARAQEVFSDETLTHVRKTHAGIQIEAALTSARRARRGMRRLYLIVNGRRVRAPAVAQAVAFAYGDVLERGKYPTGALWIDLDPADLDVNAHPQKTEVRFADLPLVKEAVTRALSELGTSAWTTEGGGRVVGSSSRAEVSEDGAASLTVQMSAPDEARALGPATRRGFWEDRLGFSKGLSKEPRKVVSNSPDGTERPGSGEPPAAAAPDPEARSTRRNASRETRASRGVADALAGREPAKSRSVSIKTADSVRDAASQYQPERGDTDSRFLGRVGALHVVTSRGMVWVVHPLKYAWQRALRGETVARLVIPMRLKLKESTIDLLLASGLLERAHVKVRKLGEESLAVLELPHADSSREVVEETLEWLALSLHEGTSPTAEEMIRRLIPNPPPVEIDSLADASRSSCARPLEEKALLMWLEGSETTGD